MPTLTIEVSDRMLEFIDREVASGEYKDRSELVQELLVLAMYDRDHEPDCYIKNGKIVLANAEQKVGLEQKLIESLDELERGEGIPWKKGDCERQIQEFVRRRES